MTWGASGRVLHPRTGAVVTSQPTVTAYRTDTYTAHPTTVQAGVDGTVTFTDLVDDIEYVALAEVGLPTKAVVPLVYQYQDRSVPPTGLNSTKLRAASDPVLPSFGQPYVVYGIPNASTRFLYVLSLDSTALHPVAQFGWAALRVQGLYLTTAGASGTVGVTMTSGLDTAIVSASGAVWNLLHDAGIGRLYLKRVSGSGQVYLALELISINL